MSNFNEIQPEHLEKKQQGINHNFQTLKNAKKNNHKNSNLLMYLRAETNSDHC
jgi:cell fate (sporulation/competence/biofilm development) regulator YlbF (YheA/YmcA/DUF963 family)